IYYKGGGTKQQAALEPAEKENDYPEPAMFGEIPAYGFFIRHVRGLEMNDVTVTYLKEDARPPFVISDAREVEFRHLRARRGSVAPSFTLKNVEDFSVQESYPLPDVRLSKVQRRQL